MDRLRGKTAIVTGAGYGIGRAVAIEFAKEGARVVVNDRREDGAGEATVDMIQAAGGEAVYVNADVSVEREVQRLIGAAVEKYGRLDVLVNNAGVDRYKPAQDLTEDDFDFQVGVNQKGTFFGIKHAATAMVATGGGSIINTASIAADDGQLGSLVYGGTKGAVISMTRIAAAELAQFNIRVNAVQPGVIMTGMTEGDDELIERSARQTPLGGRIGTPDDCAPLYVFLASDEAGFITGQKIAVDGGLMVKSHII